LKINESKSAVGKAFGRKFLGFTLWCAPTGEVKRAVSAKARETFRQKIRQLTSRTCGRSMSQIIGQLRRYVPGWKAYFNLAQAGRMDAASDAGNPAQAMASRHDDVPRAAETRCTCESGAAGGGEQSSLVA
jgi:hypothetical protein